VRINTGTAFTIAVLIHAAVIIALVVNVSLDKPTRPDTGTGDIMHATFVPPAKGSPNGGKGAAQPQKAAPAPAPEPPKAEEKAQEKTAEDLKYQIQKQQEQEQKRQQEIKKQIEEQQKKELALRKAKAEKKKLEEQKKKLEAKKQAEEARKKAEAEAKKKAAAEAKKKAEAEAKKKAEAEAKKKAEAKAKAEAAAKAKAAADAKAKAAAAANANALEDDILGTADGDPFNGHGLGSGGGDGGYGAKVRAQIEQNWRVDSSMNGKTVKLSLSVGPQGEISDVSCQGDKKVCDSAISTLNLLGRLPMPPKTCKECSNLVISMTPKI
jgi:colicin import membrane protein